jgi:8-oxo-dGTP diphosphatase
MIASLHTPRLLLRPLAPRDAVPIAGLLANWEVIRWLSSTPWPYRLEHADGFIAARALATETRCDLIRAIVCGPALIGIIAIEPRGGRPTLGFWLGEAYWGRGYMTEAASAVVDWYFEAGAGDDIASGYFAGNRASARVQARIGCVEVGQGKLWSVPLGTEVQHIDTRLRRSVWMSRRGVS